MFINKAIFDKKFINRIFSFQEQFKKQEMDQISCELLPDEICQPFYDLFSKERPTYRLAVFQPGGWVHSEHLDPNLIKKMEIYPDDIWIVTPPKAGTTLMQVTKLKNLFCFGYKFCFLVIWASMQ